MKTTMETRDSKGKGWVIVVVVWIITLAAHTGKWAWLGGAAILAAVLMAVSVVLWMIGFWEVVSADSEEEKKISDNTAKWIWMMIAMCILHVPAVFAEKLPSAATWVWHRWDIVMSGFR